MKGYLYKKTQPSGWYIAFTHDDFGFHETELPLHPDDVNDDLVYGEQVEFEAVRDYVDYQNVPGIKEYAKLITQGEPIDIPDNYVLKIAQNQNQDNSIIFKIKGEEMIVMNENGFSYKGKVINDAGEVNNLFKEFLIRANNGTLGKIENLEALAKLLAKSWFYGDWKWETPNERVMQMIMEDLGLYPFKDEDEMIQKTQIDVEFYKQAIKEVSTYTSPFESLNEKPIDKEDEKREFALFLRWFTKHYSTTNDGQFFGWADSMGNEATMNQILDHYYKEKI